MGHTTHKAVCLYPISGVAGDVHGDDMTAAGTVLGDRVAGCFDETNDVAYDGDLFSITTAGTITNLTNVDLTGATLNFLISRPSGRGYTGRERG